MRSGNGVENDSNDLAFWVRVERPWTLRETSQEPRRCYGRRTADRDRELTEPKNEGSQDTLSGCVSRGVSFLESSASVPPHRLAAAGGSRRRSERTGAPAGL